MEVDQLKAAVSLKVQQTNSSSNPRPRACRIMTMRTRRARRTNRRMVLNRHFSRIITPTEMEMIEEAPS